MSKSNILFWQLTIVLVLSLVSCKPKDTPPNVVFILVDDLGWTDLGSYGSDFYETPNIDRLANYGAKFTNAYTTCTVCSPTRASILTGKYPASLDLTDYIPGNVFPEAKLSPPDWKQYLDTSEVTIAEVFKANGYATAHIGKWHLGNDSLYWPENQGFDINVGGWAKGSPILNKKKKAFGYFSPYGNPRLDDGPDGEYLTERLVNEATTFIKTHKETPFFLNLWLYSVHTPLQADSLKVEKYKTLSDPEKRHKNPVYAAMVEHVDQAVGKLLQTLKDLHLDENTIIVFTSDNGGLVGNNPRFKSPVTSNVPLRSGKGDRFEGGIRVPCIFYYPKSIKSKTEETPMASHDFFPTLIELAALDKIDTSKFEGVSLSNLLTNDTPLKSRPLFWHYPHYHSEGAVPHSAIRLDDYKLIHNLETNTVELYDLKNDVGETQNIAETHKELSNKLFQKLMEWKLAVNAQEPQINSAVDRDQKIK